MPRPTYAHLEAENQRLSRELDAAMKIIEAHKYDMEELRRLREDNQRLLHLFEEMNARRSAAKEKE